MSTKRHRSLSPSSSPTTSLNSKKREKTKFVYAVCESMTDVENSYFIFKLDSAPAGKGDPIALRPPICIKQLDFLLKQNMAIFAVEQKLYFIGGYHREDVHCYRTYNVEAYKVDTNIFNSGNDEGKTRINFTPIPPMASPKPNHWVLGPVVPVDNPNSKYPNFYIISWSLDDDCSFEVLDTSTDKWETLKKPDIDKLLDFKLLSKSYGLDRHDLKFVLRIISSAVCGSTICLSTQLSLFVYYTDTYIWKTFGHPHLNMDIFTPKPTHLPFLGQAHPLFLGQAHPLFKKNDIFLASSFRACTPPLVYKLTPGLQLESIGQGDIFEHPGEYLEGLEHLVPRPEIVGCKFNAYAFHYKYDPRIFIVRIPSPPERPFSREHFIIDLCNVSLEGDKVKIESTVTYKHCSDAFMAPRCFFVVA